MLRRILLPLAVFVFFVPRPANAAPSTSTGSQVCVAGKLKATAASGRRLFACHSIASKRGVAVESACLGKAHVALEAGFAKAELSGACRSNGDAGDVKEALDTLATDVAAAIEGPGGASTCAGAKLAAAGKRLAAILKSLASEETKPNAPKALARLRKASRGFAAAFIAAESHPCPTTDDVEIRASQIDQFITSQAAYLHGQEVACSRSTADALNEVGSADTTLADALAFAAAEGFSTAPTNVEFCFLDGTPAFSVVVSTPSGVAGLLAYYPATERLAARLEDGSLWLRWATTLGVFARQAAAQSGPAGGFVLVTVRSLGVLEVGNTSGNIRIDFNSAPPATTLNPTPNFDGAMTSFAVTLSPGLSVPVGPGVVPFNLVPPAVPGLLGNPPGMDLYRLLMWLIENAGKVPGDRCQVDSQCPNPPPPINQCRKGYCDQVLGRCSVTAKVPSGGCNWDRSTCSPGFCSPDFCKETPDDQLCGERLDDADCTRVAACVPGLNPPSGCVQGLFPEPVGSVCDDFAGCSGPDRCGTDGICRGIPQSAACNDDSDDDCVRGSTCDPSYPTHDALGCAPYSSGPEPDGSSCKVAGELGSCSGGGCTTLLPLCQSDLDCNPGATGPDNDPDADCLWNRCLPGSPGADAATGCVPDASYELAGSLCDDGILCTVNDECVQPYSGSPYCSGWQLDDTLCNTTPKSNDPDADCLWNLCLPGFPGADAATGCAPDAGDESLGSPCIDGDPCTIDDHCQPPFSGRAYCDGSRIPDCP
jgi:hypothetical protein